MEPVRAALRTAIGADLIAAEPMPVGFGLSGLKGRLGDGRRVAIKAGTPPRPKHLPLEASMLTDLKRLSELPVPEVYHADETMLVMEWIDTDGGAITGSAERHAAELLAALHAKPFARFGYDHDTVIGPLPQPNPPSEHWLPFFRDQRLMAMARAALDEGVLPAPLFARLDRLAGRLGDYLAEPAHPSLVHGDIWDGNVLVRTGRIAAFIDPAIYCADREIELAFTTMFGTFGRSFFDAYESLLPLEPGFHETRVALYNLYPTLVHVRLFGASYLSRIDQALRRLGQ